MRNKSPTSQRSNRLPLEIWQHIFFLACADGGRTGYALTLVSKFFHDASQLVRFHSLAFTCLRRIEGFLAFVERTPTAQAKKPKVHHLLLSFSSPEFGRADDIYGADPPVADVWFRARQAREQEKAVWDKRFVVVLSALLDLVAPHLETLALLQSDAFAIPPLRYRLPRLRELTLLMGISVILNEDEGLPGANLYWPSGSAPSASSGAPSSRSHAHPSTSPASASAPIPTSSPESGFEETPSYDARSTLATRSLGHDSDNLYLGDHAVRARFPALERLHIICGRHRDWTLRDALRHLSRLAPGLAYLRISNATYTHGSHGCVAAFLRGALDLDAPSTEEHHHDGVASSDLNLFAGGPFGVDRDHQDVDMREHAMPRLRHVVVHSIPPPPDVQCATSHKGYRAFSDAMKELLLACELAPDKRMQWRESERAKHQVWEEVCRVRWIDRIEGRSVSLRSLEPNEEKPQDWLGL